MPRTTTPPKDRATGRRLVVEPFHNVRHDAVYFGGHVWTVTGHACDGKVRIRREGKEGTKKREVWPGKLMGINPDA